MAPDRTSTADAGPTHAALLRGVNVGGHARVPMETLRAAATRLGLANVSTVAASGNLLFSGSTDTAAVERELPKALHEALGFSPRVIVRSVEQLVLMAAAARRMFPHADSAKLVGVFLSGPADVDPAAAFADFAEEVRPSGGDLVVHYVRGQARSKLDAARIERVLGATTATARGINTIEKLAGST